MKKIIIKLGIFAGIVLCFMSCKKYLDVNVDPTRPTFTTADLQLSSSILYMGVGLGGDRSYEIPSIFAEYYTGGPGVSLGDWDKNTMATSDGNILFNNLYRSNSNMAFIINKSNEPYYIGIAKILSAYNYQVCADMFGDVPFVEALKGDLNDGFITSPAYDNAKDVVYPGLETMINEGKALLDSNNASLTKPGNDDLIYPIGDLTEWKIAWQKFANSLLLKIYIRQGESGKAKFKALYDADPTAFILANVDNALIAYPGGAKSKNPWFNVAQSTSLGNYFVGSKPTIDLLLNTADPRIDYFFDPTGAGTHVGMKHGDVENSPSSADYSRPSGANSLNGIIFNPQAPVILMSAWEVNFILAEAAARGWITATASDYYDEAIRVNAAYLESEAQRFAYDPEGNGGTYNLTANIEDFITGGGKIDAANPLKSIAIQKWVSMDGLQPIEGWIETRRLDNASMPIFSSPGGIFEVPTNNVLGGDVFPSIFYYPATEQDLNSKAPPQHVLTDKVFWDN